MADKGTDKSSKDTTAKPSKAQAKATTTAKAGAKGMAALAKGNW